MLVTVRQRTCARAVSGVKACLGKKARALDSNSSVCYRQRWVAGDSGAMSVAAAGHNNEDDSVVDVTADAAAGAAGCHRELRPTTSYADNDTTATATTTATTNTNTSSQPRLRQKFHQDSRPRDFHLLQQPPPPLLPASVGVRHLSSRRGKGKGGRTRGPPPPSSSNNSSSGSSSSSSSSSSSNNNKSQNNNKSNGSSAVETAEPVITLNGVSKQLPGGRELFGDASLSFVRGAKVGVLGVNGSGKSTVLKILAGEG